MDPSVRLFIILIVIVVILEFVLVRVYRKYKAKRDARFTPKLIGDSIDDIRRALDYEYREVDRYKLYEKIARREGDQRTAFFFRALVEGEKIHIDVLLDLLHQLKLNPRSTKKTEDIPVGSTMENLRSAEVEEAVSAEERYALYKENAAAKKQKEISKVFKRFQKAEHAHAEIIGAYIEDFDSGGTETKIALCPTCGTIELGTPNAYCIVCNQPGFYYKKYDGFPQRAMDVASLTERTAPAEQDLVQIEGLEDAPEPKVLPF